MQGLKLSHAVETPQLLYVADTMCSWCWGFAPVIGQLRRELGARATPRIMLGGLRPGPQAETMNRRLAKILSHHWEEVHKASGQPFDYTILKKDGFVYDTEPAAKAVFVARAMDETQEAAWELYFRLQKGFYALGQDPTDFETYLPHLNDLGLDIEVFTQAYNAPETRQALYNEFAQALEWGVGGFPTVLIWAKDRLFYITQGFLPYEDLRSKVDECLQHAGAL